MLREAFCRRQKPADRRPKESNARGVAGHKLGRLGIKSLIFENMPESPNNNLYLLLLGKESCELVPYPELRGLGVYEAAERLRDRYGRKVGMVLIGPTGEMQLTAAGIANTDVDGYPSRYCWRGGLGAVMGSKRIKAVIIDDSGTLPPESYDKKRFSEAAREVTRLIRETPQTAEVYRKFDTAAMVTTTSALGALPTRNFSTGSFEGSEKISGEALYSLRERGSYYPYLYARMSDRVSQPLTSKERYSTYKPVGIRDHRSPRVKLPD